MNGLDVGVFKALADENRLANFFAGLAIQVAKSNQCSCSGCEEGA